VDRGEMHPGNSMKHSLQLLIAENITSLGVGVNARTKSAM
jgi:hypothetical protein